MERASLASVRVTSGRPARAAPAMTVVMETGEKWALIEVFEIRFSSSVDMEVERGVIGEGGLERVDSEHECELMIEALQRELALIRVRRLGSCRWAD